MRRRRGTGCLRQLPSGRWQARITLKGRLSTSTHESREEAEAWLASRTNGSARAPDWRDLGRGDLLFQDFAESWFASRVEAGKLSPRTQELYRHLLDRHILPTFGSARLYTISPELVGEWYLRLDCGPTTRHRAYGLLGTLMNRAVRESRIKTSPCIIAGGRGSLEPRRIDVATPQEVRAIARHVLPRYRILVLLGAWSGLRYSEILGLRRQDINLDELSVDVCRTVDQVGGRWIERDAAKTPAGLRRVHLPELMRKELQRHLDAFVDDGPKARIITTRHGTPLARSNWSALFGRAKTLAGRPDITFHDLRHTHAILAAQAGATQAELMRRLGHSSVRAAMHYQHAEDERDRLLAQAIQELQASTNGYGRVSVLIKRPLLEHVRQVAPGLDQHINRRAVTGHGNDRLYFGKLPEDEFEELLELAVAIAEAKPDGWLGEAARQFIASHG